MFITATILVLTVLLAGMLLRPKMEHNAFWRAMATPLASVIGSGFLVVGPLLAQLAGAYALPIMVLLCLAGYLFGSAIRSNIRLFEPLLENGQLDPTTRWLERGSNIALAVAYVISVTYYLNLFGAFMLKSVGLADPTYTRLIATCVLVLIAAVGWWRGLSGLERMETISVSLKLAVIAGLLGGLLIANAREGLSVVDAWPKAHFGGWNEARICLGLILLVQGFETSRYLGKHYDADMRIRSMRRAQWLASGIYVAFIALALMYLAPQNGGVKAGSETAIIDDLAPLSFIVLPLLSLAALASQFSAAVADTNGGGGLMNELSENRLKLGSSYMLLCALAVVITWQADIFAIIAYASRAFAAYYMLQAGIATVLTWRAGEHGRAASHGAAALLGAMVLVFGLPAE
ncbi:MAG: hypothetical protein EP335_01270 [Alphaproteobacteria bacterium]|nr:MAG: hypothetical protein EP335_01270 [Alphaproteobacteria bacterium]